MGDTPTGTLTSGGGINQPLNPAAPTTLNWINAVDLSNLNRVLKPEILGTVISRYGKQYMTDLFTGTFGARYVATEQHTFSHWEEDFIHGPILLASTSGGANGAAVTYNIGANDIITVGQTVPPYVGTSTVEYATPLVGAIIQFENGIEGYITAVASDLSTFTAYPLSATKALPTVGDGDLAIIKQIIVGEGADKTESRNSRLIQFENIVGNHRDDHEVTDIAASSFLWFDVPNDFSNLSLGSRRVWTHKAFADNYARHCNGIDLALLDGERITNPLLAPLTNNAKKTQGMINIIENSGNVKDYTIGAMDLDDVDDLITSFTRFKAPEDQVVICGLGFYRDFQKLVREGDGLFETNGPGRLNFGQFGGGTQEINLDVDVLKRTGYRFVMKLQNLFESPDMLGNVAKYTNMGVFVPVGDAVRYARNDAATQETVPGLEIVCAKKPGTGELWLKEEFFTGSMFGVHTNTKSTAIHTLRSYIGLRLAGINRFGIMQGIAS